MRLLVVLLIGLLPLAALAQSLESETHRVTPEAGPRPVFGELRLLSALRLSLPGNEHFGGFSGLWISQDRTRMTAVTDRAHWFSFCLDSAPDGTLRSLDLLESGSLLGLDGRPLSLDEGEADAESLTRLPDGAYLVAFERRHRIWRYQTLTAVPTPFPTPEGHSEGSNEGLEGLELLSDGRLVAFSEGLRDGENWRAWLYENESWAPFTYKRSRTLQPTGAGLLPDGDVILVERFFSLAGGLHIRLARIKAEDLRPGELVESRELAAFLEPPQDIDNFEGVAAREGPGGQTLIYLLADDNFNDGLQETLLFVFQLRP